MQIFLNVGSAEVWIQLDYSTVDQITSRWNFYIVASHVLRVHPAVDDGPISFPVGTVRLLGWWVDLTILPVGTFHWVGSSICHTSGWTHTHIHTHTFTFLKLKPHARHPRHVTLESNGSIYHAVGVTGVTSLLDHSLTVLVDALKTTKCCFSLIRPAWRPMTLASKTMMSPLRKNESKCAR